MNEGTTATGGKSASFSAAGWRQLAATQSNQISALAGLPERDTVTLSESFSWPHDLIPGQEKCNYA